MSGLSIITLWLLCIAQLNCHGVEGTTLSLSGVSVLRERETIPGLELRRTSQGGILRQLQETAPGCTPVDNSNDLGQRRLRWSSWDGGLEARWIHAARGAEILKGARFQGGRSAGD